MFPIRIMFCTFNVKTVIPFTQATLKITSDTDLMWVDPEVTSLLDWFSHSHSFVVNCNNKFYNVKIVQ